MNFFSNDIFELLVTATLNVFHITIWIFQEDNENNFQTVRYLTEDEISQRRHVHILLYRDRDDPIGISNHYNSVLKKKYTNGTSYIDFGNENEVVEDNPASTSLGRKREMNRTLASTSSSSAPGQSSTSHPSSPGDVDTPNVLVIEKKKNEDDNEYQEEFDFSDEPHTSCYNIKSQDEHVIFPEHISDYIEPQTVRFMPYNINGNHSYVIEVPSKKWHKYQEDGR